MTVEELEGLIVSSIETAIERGWTIEPNVTISNDAASYPRCCALGAMYLVDNPDAGPAGLYEVVHWFGNIIKPSQGSSFASGFDNDKNHGHHEEFYQLGQKIRARYVRPRL